MFKLLKTLGKWAIALELASLAGTYFLYEQLKSNEKFLRDMEKKMPVITDTFHVITGDEYRQKFEVPSPCLEESQFSRPVGMLGKFTLERKKETPKE
mmetsp:Transcript_6630/g.10016  ORF Transcript_6630/g.10016 Transcript_6630/m.10016 type:complete len:97 (-) Transcript_6630:236-526(-)|eukprot:CAMPEP_0113943768 /NCGR_PEP_ID=MMETSP1339-20121228/27509_1 /TAXON_ID=94617 /ORGANISM="Fibrocapsa japonica" /LENGTH=96 /DNA_ID=CAMNT_0000948719 /DNA_START=41 /DNA_END=331 /DNA_ORIENTATION=+ /assembly_acc=CAM_ASM_000762